MGLGCYTTDKHFLVYSQVRRRTSVDKVGYGSHVMLYGNESIGNNFLNTYFGNSSDDNNNESSVKSTHIISSLANGVSQRDASLLHYWYKV